MTVQPPQPFRNWWREWTLFALLIICIIVWLIVWEGGGGELKVYFLDVGQGDAILIESPTRGRVLIDGGRNRKVVYELGKILPFFDRRIDVVIATHPDSDHIGGLPEVVKRYRVSHYLEPEILEENELDNVLEKRIFEHGVTKTFAKRGQAIDLGAGARITILFPDRDVSTWDTNDASVVARLDYGETSFLFTGDAGIKTENLLINLNSEILDTDVLKAGHHGSRTSTSLTFAEVVTPEYTIISAGKDNTYGHPHKEVLNILERVESKIYSTAHKGTILFESDGETYWIK